MPLRQHNQASEIKLALGDDSAERQRRQMLVALTLLLAALLVILTKDRAFWFPSTPSSTTESEPMAELVTEPAPQSTAASTSVHPAVPGRTKAKVNTPPQAAVAGSQSADASMPLATDRAVLPPLEIEVVAGDDHRTVEGGSNSVKVDLQPRAPVTSAVQSSAQQTAPSAGVSDASGRVRLSPKTAEIVSRPVEPNYPLLAKQMKVQGAVVMDALIGREGNIQHLEVLSGPSILSAAAREAVKQWRFRPYLQAGQAVETETRITVNFTIWTR